MSEAPERIYARFATTGPGINIRKWSTSGFPEAEAEYLRADTAIPKSEADAMVAAAVDACAEVLEECGIDGSAFAQTFEEYRRGCAAFEQAVREAREEGFSAGREKGFEDGRAMAHQHDKIFDEVATEIQVREAVEVERDRLAASLDRRADDYDEAFSMSRPDEHATRTALVQTAKELRRQAAAIRAPQEPSE